MTEEQKNVGINEDFIRKIQKTLLDYYNFILTGQGFEELIVNMVIMKETGFIGGSVPVPELLIGVTAFHANMVWDIEEKLKMPPAQITDMRQRTIGAFAASLNAGPIAQA